MTSNKHGGDDPYIGQVLDGKYRIDALLGQGGMGSVYRATHILMDHQCAVKVLHSAMLSDPASIPRFQREAKAAARIRHQNAISVNDFGITSDNIVYLVMEYFPGRSLREIMRADGAFSVERTARIVDRVSAALDAAHQQGIVHRDVKPDNVMLRVLPNGDDEVKVLDFGIAKMVDQKSNVDNLTITGTIIGTPHYLSPEQCRAAADLDARSDLYSLGVVTYEMLCGSVPFLAATPIAVAMMHISDEPPTLLDRVPDLPPEAEAVIFKALAKKRDDRYPSTIEFAQDFFTAVFGYHPSRDSTGTGGLGTSTAGFSGIPRKTPPPAGSLLATSVMPKSVNTPPGGVSTGSGVSARNAGIGETVAMSSDLALPGARRHATPSPSSMSAVSTDTPATRMYPPGAAGTAPASSNRMVLFAGIAVVVIAIGLAVAYFAGAFSRATPVANVPPVTKPTTPATASEPPPGMVYVAGGTFMMGKEGGDEYEGPPHSVEVKPFFMDTTEVTNKQYAEFVQATGYKAPSGWVNNTFKVGTGDLPVDTVEWKDARAYADWANKRLPTEAEWEFAARGTDGRSYPWGPEWVGGRAYTADSKLVTLQPVGSAPQGASPFGVLDMCGNVAEWCGDNFSPYPGSTAEAKDLTFKIVRGGNLGSPKERATTTFRNWYPPEKSVEGLGFRCAKSVQ
ncbi:MAG: SUMF1/EgtB/PvdO family nonheme iron enzyme [Blastocatellia bacterium]